MITTAGIRTPSGQTAKKFYARYVETVLKKDPFAILNLRRKPAAKLRINQVPGVSEMCVDHSTSTFGSGS